MPGLNWQFPPRSWHDSGDESYDTDTDKTFSSPGWIGGHWQHPSHVTCALCCGPRTNNNCRNWDYFGDWNLILSNTYILYLFIFYHLQIYNRTSASSCSNQIIIFRPQSSNHLSAMRCPALSLSTDWVLMFAKSWHKSRSTRARPGFKARAWAGQT